jgi:hypothetical protein
VARWAPNLWRKEQAILAEALSGLAPLITMMSRRHYATCLPGVSTTRDAVVSEEANENPKVPYRHIDSFDPVVQNWDASVFAGKGPYIPVPIRTFDGIPFPAWAVIALRLTQTGPWG